MFTLQRRVSINTLLECMYQPSGVEYGSANGGEVPFAPIPTYERSLTPLLQEHMDASMCYLPNGYTSSFYYGGYNGLMTEWEDYPRYANPDGAEVPPPGVYGDMYHHGYGYASYGPYPSPGSPISTLGQNGQLYGSQHYHFPATYYQPPTSTSAPYTTAQTSGSNGEVSTSAAVNIPPIPADTAKAISHGTTKASSNSNNGSAKTKPFSLCCSFDKGALPGGHPPAGSQDPRFDGMWSPVPCSDVSIFPDGQQRPPTTTASPMISHTGSTTSIINQNLRPLPHLMVNTSGQFVGVAEMVGPVNFNKTLDYWQQDKWQPKGQLLESSVPGFVAAVYIHKLPLLNSLKILFSVV
ncbi:YT521-B-like family domain containing protein [Musa troglodytarum]|uniref:YTH domain-containing family protein n=1 Tax=Musa troglodytarum TaxID=320322 RepID=A0A9E7K4H2_9LILI|nr:YT521-B-like family domain containing protein [Musa troglodytarum]